MRTTIVACAVLAMATLLPPPVVVADPVTIVDLSECIRLGLQNDPVLRVDELESTAVNARVREMRGQYVPSVSLQAGYARLSDVPAGSLGPVTLPSSPLNSAIVKLSVQQPLFTGLRIASSIRQAEALRAAAGSDAARTQREVRRAVEEAYWQLAKAKILVKASGEAEAQLERRLADVKTLLGQGVATSNDVLQAGMKLQDSRIDAGNSESARELARARLAQLVGLPLAPGIEIPEDTGAAVPAPALTTPGGLEGLVSRALAARPEVASARSRIAAQDAAFELAHAARFPNVFLTADYTLASPNPRVFPQEDTFTGTWSLGISASFDIGRYPQIAAQEEQARARSSQARETIRRVSEAVAAEVVRAAIVLDAALQSYTSLKIESSQAEENASYVEERYRQGVALPSAHLDAQTLLARARLREQAGLYDCLIARAGLDAAASE